MTTGAFGAQTPRDLLERAAQEIRKLEEATNTLYLNEKEAKNDVGSLAGACASSLWNLVDWLANSQDGTIQAALKRAGFTSQKTIRDYVKANSTDLTLCWELTNRYKHCELDGYTRSVSQIAQAALSAPPIFPPDTPIGYTFVPKVKTNAGANLPAVKVYKDALSFWEGFFKQVGL